MGDIRISCVYIIIMLFLYLTEVPIEYPKYYVE